MSYVENAQDCLKCACLVCGKSKIVGGQREQDLRQVEQLTLVHSYKQNKWEKETPSSYGLMLAFIAWLGLRHPQKMYFWHRQAVCRMAGLSALLSLTQPVFGLEDSHVAYEL